LVNKALTRPRGEEALFRFPAGKTEDMNGLQYESICCPYCGGQDHSIFALGCELDSFRFYRPFKGFETVNYVRCQICRLVFSNPRLKYSDTTLNDLFLEHVANRFRETDPESEARRESKRRKVRRVADLLQGRLGRWLEIGCGSGQAMRLARELGFTVVGTELYSAYIDYCQARGLQVRAGSVDRIEFDTASFDVVYMEDVLEHLKQPFAFIDEAARVLTPGGILFVHTWVIDRSGSVADTFGPDWKANYNLDLTAHTTIFPADLLKISLIERGFRLERVDECGSTSLGTPAWSLYCRKQ
jgi:2-polyprenyl-3-methyl-5-hydroxy-6-metoxy-1,4-benzoquinol methylase